MQFQKKVWFHTCAALLNNPALDASPWLARMISSSDWFFGRRVLDQVVQVGDVCLVMLAVVEIERLGRGVRLERVLG